MNLSGESLAAETLHLYLGDRTFVEYFNSFLLLPAFTCRVFFNVETGFFEQVHGEGVRGWRVESGGVGLTPSTSQDTLYLTDDVVGASLDREQCWGWVVEHRLPLFLHSDLFSEYKLCKLLISPTQAQLPSSSSSSSSSPFNVASRASREQLPKLDAFSVTKSSRSEQWHLASEENESGPTSTSGVSLSATLLTSPHGQRGSLTTLTSDSKSISASKSDIVLGSYCSSERRASSLSHSRGGRGGGRGTKGRHWRSRSGDEHTSGVPAVSGHSKQEQPSDANLRSALIGSKSGMSVLWRFLRGKAGEKNWLFCLDAERVKYCSGKSDQQRLLRELRERYLHAGSPLELPTEVRGRLAVGGASSRLSLKHLKQLQRMLVEGLRTYWVPRFILHHQHLQSSHSSPTRPQSALHPHTLTERRSQFSSSSSTTTAYHRPPLTPSHTPTFKRITSGRPRSKSTPANHVYNQQYVDESNQPRATLPAGRSSLHSTRVMDLEVIQALFPHEVDSDGKSKRPRTEPAQSRPRRVWESLKLPESDLPGDDGSRLEGEKTRRWCHPCKQRRSQSSIAQHSQLAKYTSHHLPDINSRCASAQDSGQAPGMCGSCCHILSVSGTPVLLPSSPAHHREDPYSLLLSCLALEHRKAGGYFQKHLKGLGNKVYLNCLLFWRDVQSYKSLFVGPSFSPCAVEMRAKALHGRYIVEGSSEGIQCPSATVAQVAGGLWPAYEDLFDEAEEYALTWLLEEWAELCSSEDQNFQKLDVVPLTSRLWSAQSDRKGLATHDELALHEEEYGFHYEDGSPLRSPSPTKHPSRPPSTQALSSTLLHSPPTLPGTPTTASMQRQAISLNDIMTNSAELEYFKIFLNENLAAQDLMCWMEIEAFRGIPVSDRPMRDVRARQLRSKYLNKKYFFGPSSPASKEAQRQVVAAGGGGYGSRVSVRPKTPVFREAQKHVRARLEKKWLTAFITSPEFLARNGDASSLSDGTTEGGTSREPNRQYGKSFHHSHEAILFRKALQDEGSRNMFKLFLNVKAMQGTHPHQDIEFWLEVQRYKEMYHAHTTDTTLQCKVTAIIDCYFQSSVPPRLQLDIPVSVGEQVIKRGAAGPYVFREAQAAVFKYLLQQWQDYQNFVSGFTDAEARVALDKLRSQLRDFQAVHKEQSMTQKMEDDKQKLAMPRFETALERVERLKKEKELAEFGEVSVAFRLSVPSHSYTYYTDLPEKFYEEQQKEVEKEEDIRKLSKKQVSSSHATARHIRSKSCDLEENSSCKKSQLRWTNQPSHGVGKRAKTRHSSSPCAAAMKLSGRQKLTVPSS